MKPPVTNYNSEMNFKIFIGFEKIKSKTFDKKHIRACRCLIGSAWQIDSRCLHFLFSNWNPQKFFRNERSSPIVFLQTFVLLEGREAAVWRKQTSTLTADSFRIQV